MKSFLLFFTLILLFSCKEEVSNKDQDETTLNGDWNFVGKWYIYNDSFLPNDSSSVITKKYSLKLYKDEGYLFFGDSKDSYKYYFDRFEEPLRYILLGDTHKSEGNNKIHYPLFDFPNYFLEKHHNQNVLFVSNFYIDSTNYDKIEDCLFVYAIDDAMENWGGKNRYEFKGSAVRILK